MSPCPAWFGDCLIATALWSPITVAFGHVLSQHGADTAWAHDTGLPSLVCRALPCGQRCRAVSSPRKDVLCCRCSGIPPTAIPMRPPLSDIHPTNHGHNPTPTLHLTIGASRYAEGHPATPTSLCRPRFRRAWKLFGKAKCSMHPTQTIVRIENTVQPSRPLK